MATSSKSGGKGTPAAPPATPNLKAHPQLNKSARSKTLISSESTSDEHGAGAQEGSLAFGKGPLASAALVRELLGASEVELIKRLRSLLELEQGQTDPVQSIVLDYHASAFWYAKERGFSETATSAFVALCNKLLNNCLEKKMSLEENTAFLTELLPRHTGEDDGAMDFDAATAKVVQQYVQTGLFQHYKLYQQLGARKGTPIPAYVFIQVPGPLPSLDSGVMEITEPADKGAAS